MSRVDTVLAQWKRERPDLDVAPISLIGRLKRAVHHVDREMGKTFAEHGLNLAGFDVLATLRRAGPPYRLSPGDLLGNMMVTSGTMTHRIDQLEKAGYVKRVGNPEDGRSVLITLTKKGLNVIEPAVSDHVETLTRITAGLSDREFKQLDRLLSVFLETLEAESPLQ